MNMLPDNISHHKPAKDAIKYFWLCKLKLPFAHLEKRHNIMHTLLLLKRPDYAATHKTKLRINHFRKTRTQSHPHVHPRTSSFTECVENYVMKLHQSARMRRCSLTKSSHFVGSAHYPGSICVWMCNVEEQRH